MIGALALASVAGSQSKDSLGPNVKSVSVRGWSADVTTARCSFQKPCVGLERGLAVHVELSSQGNAAVYLKDGAFFYNQEGRLIIVDGNSGDMQLWPGTPTEVPAKKTYELYVVASVKQLPAFKGSTPLDRLPEGNRWGPAYLQTK